MAIIYKGGGGVGGEVDCRSPLYMIINSVIQFHFNYLKMKYFLGKLTTCKVSLTFWRSNFTFKYQMSPHNFISWLRYRVYPTYK